MHDPPPSRDYARVLLIVVLMGGLLACSLWIFKPFLGAFIWATMIVVATWPLKVEIERNVRGRRWIAVTLMTLAILLLIIVPLVVAVQQFVEHFDDMRAGVTWLASLPPPPEWVSRLPVVGASIAAKWNEFAGADPLSALRPLLPYAGNIATWIAARAGSIGAVFIDLLLIVVFSAILYSSGETVATSALRLARRVAGERGVRSVELAGLAVRAVALGVVVTAMAQSVLAGIGLAVAGVPNALLLTAVMFVLCVAQIGAVPVLAPAAIWLFWRDATGVGRVHHRLECRRQRDRQLPAPGADSPWRRPAAAAGDDRRDRRPARIRRDRAVRRAGGARGDVHAGQSVGRRGRCTRADAADNGDTEGTCDARETPPLTQADARSNAAANTVLQPGRVIASAFTQRSKSSDDTRPSASAASLRPVCSR